MEDHMTPNLAHLNEDMALAMHIAGYVILTIVVGVLLVGIVYGVRCLLGYGDLQDGYQSKRIRDNRLKADFTTRLTDAKTFKAAAAVREEVLSSDLPKDYKDGFCIRFKEKFAEKKP